MDRVIYLAGTGAKATQYRQDAVANNLANISTPGFKAEIAMYRTAPGQGPVLQTRAYAVESSTGADHSAGAMMTTDNPMDVAVAGDGWLALQGNDGQERYARTGTLVPNAEGQLTLHGMLVQGDGGPMTVGPDQMVSIAQDGTVSAVAASGVRGAPVVLGRLKLVQGTRDEVVRGADGLFRSKSGEDLNADPTVQVTSGKLEASNVNPTEALVQMIAVARQFEMHMKVLQTAQEDSRAAAQLLGPTA